MTAKRTIFVSDGFISAAEYTNATIHRILTQRLAIQSNDLILSESTAQLRTHHTRIWLNKRRLNPEMMCVFVPTTNNAHVLCQSVAGTTHNKIFRLTFPGR
jgi:hypothetical protein